jgi:hypothetical protein
VKIVPLPVVREMQPLMGCRARPFASVGALVGVVMIAVASVRVVAPMGTGPVSLINVGLGLWLVVAPFVLGHSATGATQATWNDIIVGLIVVMVAGVSCFTAESRGAPADTARRGAD